MKPKKPNPTKELYAELRRLSWDDLWTAEVPRFNAAAPRERTDRVAVIRAVGVVFSESGPATQKEPVRQWLRSLLRDPDEKVRRYAMAALPKIGADATEETELLELLQTTTGDREKKFLGRALDKIGGATTLETLGQTQGLHPQTEQKVKAAVARSQSPSQIRLDAPLPDFAGFPIHLRCRNGLESIVRDEVEASRTADLKFQVTDARPSLVVLDPSASFTLGDLYSLRCFHTVGFVLGTVSASEDAPPIEPLAHLITSPFAQRLFRAFTAGPIRYRLDFISKGHQRGAIRELANRAYALCPEILNDPREAPWAINIYPAPQGYSVELSPRLIPDPRFAYRMGDVPAASHPPLAACMALLAGPVEGEIVWDPFCGSGLELIEASLRNGVKTVIGTDRDPAAIVTAERNFAAAKISGTHAHFSCDDFRDFAEIAGLAPGSVGLVITNPPMGRRVPIGNLRQLIEDLFHAAATVLRPGGRLVFANPMLMDSPAPTLVLQSRQSVDLGGLNCRLEMYLKK
ncbi:hypothetical protein BH09VER1_BH09VER1_25000 [soil metagenome]